MPAERRLDVRVLSDGWSLAPSAPGACPDPAAAAALSWRPAPAGMGGGHTVAGALAGMDSGQAVAGAPSAMDDLDARDWWFRVRVDAPPAGPDEELVLGLGGLATLAEVWVDGVLVLRSESMYAAHEVPVTAGIGELTICFRALAPRLAERRRPRARWRTRVVAAPNLRFFRTMLLGRAPGFAPGPAVVGPWRPVVLHRRRGVTAEAVRLRARLEGSAGVLAVAGRLRAIGEAEMPRAVTVLAGAEAEPMLEAELGVDADGAFAGELRLPEVRPWWPHTHGAPALHPVRLLAGETLLLERRVGFRSLQTGPDLERDGPALHVNGVAVFCRGAVWAPPSLADPDPGPGGLRPLLERAAAAGINMLRIPGTACYESDAFHDLCDELGILVWQDLMFANLDYPESDPEFMAAVEREVRAELARIAGRPSLAVLCGGSEVAQQVAMLGLDPGLAEGPLYGELLPRLVAEAQVQAPYLPSAPWGGALPFRTDRGVANYFGVGAYLRPLEDARRAEVRFASECLAFANVPDHPPGGEVLGPAWKAGVPRDAGAGWDFDDVRDHYLRALFGEEPMALRYADPDRYLALSRQLTGELMGETFGEWRRAGSPCGGGLVLWLKDLAPGAGWGLLDERGQPKLALAILARTLAPVAVWMTDEGLNGIGIHLANDRPRPLRARLRVTLYRDGAVEIDTGVRALALDPHATMSLDAEQVIGRFADIAWAYRFGPPGADVVCASLDSEEGEVLSQAFRFPVGRPLARRPVAELGLTATVEAAGEHRAVLQVGAARIAYGVRIEAPGWVPDDDGFCIEPGRPRRVELRREPAASDDSGEPRGRVSALNCSGTATIVVTAPHDPPSNSRQACRGLHSE